MVLKQTTVFNVSLHLRAIFQSVVCKFDDSARSLARKIFLFEALVSLRVAKAALVALSHVPWLVGVVFGPVLLGWMGVVFGPLLDIWNLPPCLL